MVIKIYEDVCTFVMFNDEEASEFVFVLVLGRLLWQMSGRLLVRQYSALREQIANINQHNIRNIHLLQIGHIAERELE